MNLYEILHLRSMVSRLYSFHNLQLFLDKSWLFCWQKNADISKALSLVVCSVPETSLTLVCNLHWPWLEFMVYKSGFCLKHFLYLAHQTDYVIVRHKQNISLGPCKFKFTIYSWVSLITIILKNFWNVNLLKIKLLTEVQCLLQMAFTPLPDVSFICHLALPFIFCM